jgi:hypothetical protein
VIQQEDGSSNHPFDRIQEAINSAEDGSIVFVHAGTYREIVDLARQANPGDGIRSGEYQAAAAGGCRR